MKRTWKSIALLAQIALVASLFTACPSNDKEDTEDYVGTYLSEEHLDKNGNVSFEKINGKNSYDKESYLIISKNGAFSLKIECYTVDDDGNELDRMTTQKAEGTYTVDGDTITLTFTSSKRTDKSTELEEDDISDWGPTKATGSDNWAKIIIPPEDDDEDDEEIVFIKQ